MSEHSQVALVASIREDGSAEWLAIDTTRGQLLVTSYRKRLRGSGQKCTHILTDQTDLIEHDGRLGTGRSR